MRSRCHISVLPKIERIKERKGLDATRWVRMSLPSIAPLSLFQHCVLSHCEKGGCPPFLSPHPFVVVASTEAPLLALADCKGSLCVYPCSYRRVPLASDTSVQYLPSYNQRYFVEKLRCYRSHFITKLSRY